MSKVAITTNKKIQDLFHASARFTELLEEFIEERSAYHPTFLRDLRKALRETQAGKLIPLQSLRELK